MQVTNGNHSFGNTVSKQEGTVREPGHREETAATCQHISRMLAHISDKWTLLVVRSLGRGDMRFNALRREIGEISQKMLASTLRGLEENGFVVRTVTPTKPPQVEYSLTPLGRDFLKPVCTLANWVTAHSEKIEAAREAYARQSGIARVAKG